MISAVGAGNPQYDAQQLAAIAKLSATDRHVRAHEAAHLAAAGPYAIGGASYGYTMGPDGNLYATSGEVPLDVSPDPSDPKKTIEKARVIEAAANAPADPSTQDRMVAAMAAQMEASAQAELTMRAIAAYTQQRSGGAGRLLSVLG